MTTQPKRTLLSRAIKILGLYSDEELAEFERADTEPCGPPSSAPPVPAPEDDCDEYLHIGGRRGS